MSKYGSGKGILRQSHDGNRQPKKITSFSFSPTSSTMTITSPDTFSLQPQQTYSIMQNSFQPYVQYPEYAAYPSYVPEYTTPQYSIPQYSTLNTISHPYSEVAINKYVQVPQVPVPVETMIQVPVHHYVEPQPVDRVVQVPVYVDRYIDRYVTVPVDRPIDRPVYVQMQAEEKQQPYVGIGLSLERADGVGDEVVSINDIDVRELSIGTMKQLTVGPVGSQVKLDMLRSSLPYTVFLERLLPTHTTYENAAAAGVLVHPGGGHVGASVPDGQSVRLGSLYYDALGGQHSSIRRSGSLSGSFGPSTQFGPHRAIPA